MQTGARRWPEGCRRPGGHGAILLWRIRGDEVAQYRKRGMSAATRFAYVLKEPVLDPDRFGETVAVNRWMRLKVFDNLKEALEWLAPDSAGEPGAKSQPGACD